ncbi:MAG: thiosulfate/3-mercaptopyruvate sulfurtransferase [Variibacter sp.]|jgi:thiosulfate/3-mercaptopyruvate sulfurtransferase|nr:thiosulfate/3-mercaptopyruvate sulfurtransferase [Variibacter sp.]
MQLKSLAVLAALTAGTLGLSVEARASESPLVNAEWVEQNLKNPKVRVVEVSVEPGLFERGHIPGAQNIVWHTDLVETVTRDVASRDKFQALLRRLGVDKDTTVVLYGDNNNWFAAWGAWVFSTYGLDNVKLLDGGRKKWEADKRPFSTRVELAAPSQITLAEPNAKLRARLSDVLDVVQNKRNTSVVDIRSPDEFSGKIIAPQGSQELSVRAGHVPGAVNIPWSRAVAEDGTIKPAAELKKLYADAGIDGSKPIIVYCRIGERSSHTWFVLAKILGYDVRNYDGSWTEYGNSVGVPIINVAGTVWGGK